MKIYISVDMEGMAGICHARQEYDDTVRFRKAMQQQVEWVIEGIQKSSKNAEVDEILIADSHGAGRHLSYDDLSDMDERIYLVSGTPRPQYMMPAMHSGYDVVFMVGYHAGVGQECGNMNHSYWGRTFHDFQINGKYMNEATINGAYAGSLNVPVGLVIGDSGLEKQLIDDAMMPWVEFVRTKDALSFLSAKFRPKKLIKEETIEKIDKVLNKDLTKIPRYILEKPYLLHIEMNMCSMRDTAGLVPGAKCIDGRTIELESEDYEELFNAIVAIGYLTSSAFPADVK